MLLALCFFHPAFPIFYHLLKYIEKTINRQSQDNRSQDQGKYHLIGAEFFHHIGLAFRAWSKVHGAERKVPQTE